MFSKKLLFFLFFLYLSIINMSFSNEIVDIKTYDRDEYIRIMFELTEKPNYIVKQENNKINIFLQNTSIKNPLNFYKNINNFDVIDDIINVVEKTNIRFLLTVKNKANIKRYLYTAPSNLTKYYRFIVDINKIDQEFENLENIISKTLDNEKKEQNVVNKVKIDDFLNKYILGEEKTISDIILENVKPKNIVELIEFNNISDEEVTKDIENQNNDKVNIDDFLKKISIKLENEPKKQGNINNHKNYNFKEEYYNIKNKNKNKKKYVIVLDAGHGGRDPGAMGLFGTKEKNINLSVARAIKNELDKDSKFRVYLTRNDDKFIELYERVNRSRNLRADLFISIHSDSTKNRKARGLSVYTLKKSASDTRTKELYTKNGILKNKNLNNLKYDTINAILDINRYDNLNKSIKFSEKLLKNFKKQNINLLHNPHKYGNFAVLLAPEYPSVLIELGFISNPYDEKMLNSKEFKKRISFSVANAVREYFRQ